MDVLWMKRLKATCLETDEKHLAKRIEMIRDHIGAIRKGAFVPFAEQPWVRAVMLILGGGGSLILLEFLP
jgi:hypothetical protein